MGLLLQQPAELLGELRSFGSLEKELLPTINKKKGIVAGGGIRFLQLKVEFFVVELKNLWEFTRINAEGKKK